MTDNSTQSRKHTPGPWREVKMGNGRRCIRDADRRWIAHTAVRAFTDRRWSARAFTDESEIGNACLIAAAPDMLAALKRIAGECIGTGNAPDVEGIVRVAMAAIVKAEPNGEI